MPPINDLIRQDYPRILLGTQELFSLPIIDLVGSEDLLSFLVTGAFDNVTHVRCPHIVRRSSAIAVPRGAHVTLT